MKKMISKSVVLVSMLAVTSYAAPCGADFVCDKPIDPCDVAVGETPPAGCSEQQPFLVNDEMLVTPLDGTSDEYEITFREASTFDASENKVFYPLDVARNAENYQEPEIEDPEKPRRGIFSFCTDMFDYCFSKTIGFGRDFFGHRDISDTQYGERSDEAQDRRQRYIANTMVGIDQDHKLVSTVMGDATYVDAGVRLNDPVSLLHYAEATKGDVSKQCKFMFREFSAEGVMCRCMGGFGMDAWMPFFNITQVDEMETSTIMMDTENTLLAMASQKTGVQYLSSPEDSDENKMFFLKNMMKPMITMMNLCKRFMHGNDRVDMLSDPQEIEYAFDENNSVDLVFALTNDGTTVDDFVGAKMLGLKSVFSDSINSCEIKRLWKTVGTYHIDKPISRSYKKYWWSKRTTVDWEYGPEGKMTNTQWVDWCQKGMDKKGMFDYLTDWNKLGFMNPLNWMRGFFAMFDYQVTNFGSTVQRGLVLHIKTAE